MYQFSDRVRFSEMDERGRMRLPSILRVMQDCSDYHSESLGIGHQWLKERDRAWILLYWQVIIERYPADREEIVVETRPWKFEHFRGYRNFALYDAAGVRLAAANSLWSMMDLSRMRPTRPSQVEIDRYGVDERLVMPYSEGRKIRPPEEMAEYPTFPVRRQDLDMNHHVNNVRYIDMACEYFPEDLEIREMQAEYRMSARMGDMICPFVGRDEDWYVVVLGDAEGKPYAIVRARGSVPSMMAGGGDV